MIIVAVGSQGWTPQAESLMSPMLAVNPNVLVHLGDTDFSFENFQEACTSWPGLAYYCDGTQVIATREQVQAGWTTMMDPLRLTRPTYITWGNHEYTGSKYGVPQQYYRTLFGTENQWYATDVTTPTGTAHLTFIDTNRPLTVGSVQHTWLVGDLQAAQGATWRVVYGHYNPWSQIKPAPGLRDILGPLFDANSVDLYLSGHPLAWERTKQVTYSASAQDKVVVVDEDSSVQKGAGRVWVSAGGGGMHVCGTFGVPGIGTLKTWMAQAICGSNIFALLEWLVDGSLSVKAIDAGSVIRDLLTITP